MFFTTGNISNLFCLSCEHGENVVVLFQPADLQVRKGLRYVTLCYKQPKKALVTLSLIFVSFSMHSVPLSSTAQCVLQTCHFSKKRNLVWVVLFLVQMEINRRVK
ncbi:hypothetical protein GOODEAATRI_028626 [Goodea atripinnis]|uniref:Uncharacterized protein n=1 Tax=Goodea atripinnis TaxID=208336 RepID=A0ABV0NEE4_9TELE